MFSAHICHCHHPYRDIVKWNKEMSTWQSHMHGASVTAGRLPAAGRTGWEHLYGSTDPPQHGALDAKIRSVYIKQGTASGDNLSWQLIK